MKIMIFLHGTAIMHKESLGKTPTERVKQIEESESSVRQYETYVPVGNANIKIKKWHEQGAEIVYLSSHEDEGNVRKDILALTNYDFPDAPVLYRRGKETYADIAERVMPDILIEDDCESIGGEPEMTYPHIDHKKKRQIKSIVVKEFSGIDNLPGNLDELKDFVSNL